MYYTEIVWGHPVPGGILLPSAPLCFALLSLVSREMSFHIRFLLCTCEGTSQDGLLCLPPGPTDGDLTGPGAAPPA